MSKKTKLLIVNSLTFSRVLGTILMPVFYTYLSSQVFLIVIGLLLITDFFDGMLARKWKVSTIFGSLLDMAADKLLALSILVILGFIYPLMFIPLIFEVLITLINIRAALLGIMTKSSEIGRIKMWILGLAIFSLLLTGLCMELEELLVRFDIFELIVKNAQKIEYISISGAIVAEFIVVCDYFIRTVKKSKKKDNFPIIRVSDILKNMTYIKSVIFDEDYYIKTKDKSLYDKLMNNI